MNNMYEILAKLNSVDQAPKAPLNESVEAVSERSTGDYSATKARAGKDIGKPGKAFGQIAKSAGERYGSKERGEKVAGAVLAKLRAKEDVEEGILDTVKKVGGKVLDKLGHGSDEDLIKDLQRKAGVPVTGKKPEQAKEGNAFSGAVAKAKADGIQPGEKINVGGKEYPVKEEESGMTPKQKKFAALAEPKDKITFADKIAGAKKEVDEVLGDVAAKAMKQAVGVAGDEVEEGWDDMIKSVQNRDHARVGDKWKTSKGEVEKTSTGVVHRRSYDPNTGETPDDGSEAGAVKKGRGRPKGTGKSIGAKGPSGKSKLLAKEGADYGQAQQIYDELADLRAVAKQAQGGGQFPQGFASRLEAILYAAMTLIKNQQPGNAQVREDDLEEKAVSKKQQKFMGMVHAAQKGEKPASKEVAKVAKTMKKKDAEDFASTKHKGLPEKKKPEGKKKEESVEETSDNKPSKGGMQFGKGVYEAKLAESFKTELSKVLNEGMNINASTDSEGHSSLSVSATDEDAAKLAQLLKLAGMGSEGYEEVCPACGSSECGCEEQVDEELANSADNTEYAGIDTMTKTLSGGLNGPKTTGQTTAPVVNRDPARGSVGPMSENKEAKLWELYQRYSSK